MKVGSPLAVLSASFVTWFWLEKRDELRHITNGTLPNITLPTVKSLSRHFKGLGAAGNASRAAAAVASLQVDIKKRDDRIVELEAAVQAARAAATAQGAAGAGERKKIAELQSEVEERDGRIAELEAARQPAPAARPAGADAGEVASLRSGIKERDGRIAARNERIAALEAAAEEEVASLRKEIGERDGRIAEAEAELRATQAAAGDLHEELQALRGETEDAGAGASGQDLQDVASVGDSGDASGTTDPNGDSTQDLMELCVRSVTLLGDAVGYGVDTLAAQIWQWPADSATTLPHLGSVARAVLARAEGAAEDVSGLLPSGAAALLPAEVREQVNDIMAVPMNATRAVVGTAIEDFLAQHPEHRAIIGGRDPGLVVLLLAGLAYLALYEVYGFAKAIYALLKTLVFILCIPCRCCLRRKEKPLAPADTPAAAPDAVPAAAPAAPHPDGRMGGSPSRSAARKKGSGNKKGNP